MKNPKKHCLASNHITFLVQFSRKKYLICILIRESKSFRDPHRHTQKKFQQNRSSRLGVQ